MRKNLIIFSIVAGLLAVFAIIPVTAAQFSPAVFAIDQDVVDGTVTVTRVTSNEPGWIVVHADDNGQPGPVLGQSAVPSGITADVLVDIDTEGVTDTLWAMLHADEGVAGEYEFPGPDEPVTVNDVIVMYPFAVGEVAQSIAGVAASTEGFSTLVQAVEAAGLLDTLQSEGPFTVFAPTDEAFAAVPAETLDALLADPEQLTQVLLYHVIPGTVMAADIADGMEAETVQGSTVTLTTSDGTVMVNDATVTATDITAYNGVIHVIDQVLLPPAPEEAATEEETASEEEAATDEEAADEETAEAAAQEEPTPAVSVSDQESSGSMVTVESVTAAQAGWIVIHADDNGAPGAVLGQAQVPPGESTGVVVDLSEPLSGDTTLWAMLHVDEGEADVYEFPGPDGPVLLDGNIVMMPFAVTVAGAAPEATPTEEPAEEATPEATATEEPAEEATPEATATEEPAEEAAPEETAPEESAAGTPSVTVIDQGSTGTNVAVLQAVADQPGWMVIHADENGAPGAVLGQASLPAGTTDNIIVTLDEPISGEVQLWAMLHVDEGEVGVYEFPGPDTPVTVNNEIVMEPFTAIVTGADEGATATPEEEAPAEPTATPTFVPTAPPDVEPTPMPTEEEGEVAPPDMLPQTGFSLGSNTGHLPIVVTIIVGLFAAAVVTRRTKA